MDDKERVETLNAAKSKWQQHADKIPAGKTCKAYSDCTTSSGIDVKLLYTPEDVAEMDYTRDLGFPGEYPYTRGSQATMYRGRLWTMRQYAGFATVEESNRRYKYLLNQGQTGLSIAFDLPTQLAWTQTIHSRRVRWARSACRSVRSRTWRCCSMAFPSTRSARP